MPGLLLSFFVTMDLKGTIIKQISAHVKRKGTQEYITDEDGIIDPALQDLAPLKRLTP